ncbi:MAG: alpha/beta fold hydrolase [Tepidisphaeraceae bacterium]
MPTFQNGQSKIEYHDLASSSKQTPLLLVHGFPLDSRIWIDAGRLLSAQRRVIVPDLPGFGSSVTAAPFTMASLADDLVALMASAGIDRFVIAGLSMGGYIALTLAKRQPAVLAGLIMVDSKAVADDAAGKAARSKMIETAATQGSTAVAAAMMPKMLHPAAHTDRPQLVAQLNDIMTSQPARTIEYASAAMRDRDDFTAFVPTLKVPFGVVVGAGDALISNAVAASMVQTRGSLFVIENAGHLAPLEQPDATAAAINAFLHQHAAEVR